MNGNKKKIWIGLTVIGFGTLLGSQIASKTFLYSAFSKIQHWFCTRNEVSKEKSYFDAIPITKWTLDNTPCVTIQIGDQVLCADMDLGFSGVCSIDNSILDKIEEKTKICSKKMYGFQGYEYNDDVFKVSNIIIGNMSVNGPEIQEEDKEFHSRAAFNKDGGESSPAELARVGWKIFQNRNLLLDLKNEKIAFCDSLLTLKKQGYDQKFVKTPLIIDTGWIQIDIESNGGFLRCILDTGCTFNVLNVKNEGNKSMQELFWNSENFYTTHTFKIYQKEFGPITFRQIPMDLPTHINGILGIDFFTENIVFLDFDNGFAYFSRA